MFASIELINESKNKSIKFGFLLVYQKIRWKMFCSIDHLLEYIALLSSMNHKLETMNRNRPYNNKQCLPCLSWCLIYFQFKLVKHDLTDLQNKSNYILIVYHQWTNNWLSSTNDEVVYKKLLKLNFHTSIIIQITFSTTNAWMRYQIRCNNFT